MNENQDILISVPTAMAAAFSECEPRLSEHVHAFCDPEDLPLGSGGGTANVLARGWEKLAAPSTPFSTWIQASRKIIIHGGGQSRRLPGYAPTGKLFIPIPAFRWTRGHRIDQNLLELQHPFLKNLSAQADTVSRVLIASGDVLVRSDGALPRLPQADVVMLGLWTRPEEAQDFGVMFCDRQDPGRLICFEQKPTPDRIRELAAEYLFMIDVGIWLLSERAVRCLMRRSGLGDDGNPFDGGEPKPYELYGAWALHLGANAVEPDEEVGSLSVRVVPLADGEFYHFGTSRDVIRSLYRLQNLVVDQTRLGTQGVQPHPRQFVQNAVFDFPLRQEENHTLWIENATVSADWSLASQHVLTGIPDNDWKINIEAGTCLDFVPLDEDSFAIRFYGIDDPFRGPLSSPATLWMGKSAEAWFESHGLAPTDAGSPEEDIHDAPLFPVLPREDICSDFVQWLVSSEPDDDEALRSEWLNAPRKSSATLNRTANLDRLYAQRRSTLAQSLPRMAENAARSMFYKLDLDRTADIYAAQDLALPAMPSASQADPLVEMHDRMFRAAVMRKRGDAQSEMLEAEAFRVLRDTVVGRIEQAPVNPSCQLMEDQIVWGRCPVRLDIAGGWTDTPPYCYEFGGRVVNVAVDLNGQPPIQVFARLSEKPELVIRSIDLGLEERVSDYEGLENHERLSSGFAIARAALALAGFHPRFNGEQYACLRDQLEAFGGGIELSMLAAVPKGSGLGASSILSASILGTLSDMSGLAWDHYDIMRRTTALEQMLTSGGGWQDQIGGLLYGAKLIETRAGLDQSPTIRWLPNRFFTNPDTKASLLLYYTGVTRVAHNILGEIVRGIFLNAGRQLDIIRKISTNAEFAYDVMQQHDFNGFAEAVQRSWMLNQELDSGTNVAEVQAVIDLCAPDLAACKLLGAGGGGYLLVVAHDPDAAYRLRTRLEQNPPNARARFVDFSISESGLQTTRS